jgi:hypothetical protein
MIPPILPVLFGAAITIAACIAAGRLIVRDRVLMFPVGAAVVSVLVFVVTSCGLAYPVVFLALSTVLIVLAVRPGRAEGALPGYGVFWKTLFWTALVFVGAICLLHALAPEVSPAGTRIYLADVIRRSPTEAASVEMLFLMAFAFGRHSAAALVSYAFLLTLPLVVLGYGRRVGLAKVGVFAAVFTLASPVVMVDGSSACPDVALACALFAVFSLLEKWDTERTLSIAAPIGLLAGFACGAGPAGWIAPLYALGFMAWRGRRQAWRLLAATALCALSTAAPALWTLHTSPPAPPPPALAGVLNAPEAALHVTILGGAVEGFVGPLFLLAPFALLAARTQRGRRVLIAAALIALPFSVRPETRFLIPALPFVSFALGLALVNTRVLLPLLAVAQVVLAWPQIAALYGDPSAWRTKVLSVGPALYQDSRERYLASHLPGYALARSLDARALPPGKVLAVAPLPSAYTAREVLVSAPLVQMLRTAAVPELRPTGRERFSFPRRQVRAVRATSSVPWTCAELRLLDGGRELARSTQWRLRARPDTAGVQFAFDNNPVTSWSGERIEVNLGAPVAFDAVLLETPTAQTGAGLMVEVLDESGQWQLIPDQPKFTDVLFQPGLRRMATLELQARGVVYLAVEKYDPLGSDLYGNARSWAVEEVADESDVRLYRLLPRSYK